MKTQVSCDDVFEILTRGPFPAGREEDEAVERHLAACHECRRLADALRPAVALFHEVLVDDEGDRLPEYRGNLPQQERLPSLNRLAADAIYSGRRPAKPLATLEKEHTLLKSTRILCASLLGCALCLVVWGMGTFVNQSQQILNGDRSPRFQASQVRITPATHVSLAALGLPAKCYSPPATAGKMVCCTNCHAATKPQRAECQTVWAARCERCHDAGPPARLTTRNVALAQQACQACHDG